MPKKITDEQVEHIASLAKIELTKEEKKQFTKQLNEILDFFKKIDMINTEDVPPTYRVIDATNVFREDEVKPSMPIKKVFMNTTKKEKSYFKAPRIL
jgi:aspartyl-tRNA(Asn)/glutamyl-tRNA(Gln) amidotransferase subunit C